MNQFFSLYQHINLNRTSSRKAASRFPLNGQSNVQKVISHQGSKEIWSIINSTQEKGKQLKNLTKYYPQLLPLCQCQLEKSVCAKIIKAGDTIAECFQCRADPSCIICMDCFKNSNHKGHRVVFKKGAGGCCDCGDIEAWKQEGFCTKHTGKAKEITIEAKEIEFVREILFELFYLYSFLKLSGNKICNDFFKGFISLLSSMAGQGVKGMKLISLFLDSDLPKKYSASSKLFGKMLQIIMTMQFSEGDFRSWQNLFIELFPYYPFKQQLIAAYIRSYKLLYKGEYRGAESVACQIMTSYKLVEDYTASPGAVPIIIEEGQKMSQLIHLTKVFTYDLNRIHQLQGDAPIKYWGLQIKYGIVSMFGYYETLKSLARKEKQKANLNQLEVSKKTKLLEKKKKKRKTKRAMLSSDQQKASSQQQIEGKYSVFDFLKRNNGAIESQFFLLSEFMEILPQLVKDKQLMLNLIKQLMTNITKQITFGDDLLLYRPYDRMFGITLFYIAHQTPFLLTTPQTKDLIRQASGLNEQKLQWWLHSVQKRMMETYCFFSHLQTCEGQGYHNTFYSYIALYSSKNCILGSLDLLALKQIILLGGREVYIDFKSMMRLQLYEQPNVWNLKLISTLVSQIGLLYTGYFAQIYLANYGEKSGPAQWLQFETKKAIKKFITAEGGSCTLQRAKQFAEQFILTQENKVKIYLKQLCNFNKERKVFQLLPPNIDKNGINFRDFSTRGKMSNQNAQSEHPRNTIQFIEYHNKTLFSLIWNKTNLESLCAILLSFHDDIQKKSKDQLIEYYAIPCKLHYLLKNLEVGVDKYGPLIQLLQNFEVSGEIRKGLGVLVNELSPVVEESEMQGEGMNSLKEIQRQKKQKKLDQLKKRNSENMIKIKEKHQIQAQPMVIEGAADECVICKKKGGNLVWMTKMTLKNIQKLLGFGEGTLTLSFTSCYHAFDYECIIQNSVKRSTHEVLFRCPVCRRVGNTLLSINNTLESQVYIDAALDRIMQVALSLRNYKQFITVQEILKSFYHYVMMGFVQHEYVRQRRVRLYREVLQMLINMKSFEQIASAEKNLEENRIALHPKIAKEVKQKINLEQIEVEEYDSDDFDEDDQQFEQLMEIEEDKIIMERSGKKGKQQEKPKEEKPKKCLRQEPSKLFNYTLKRVIDFVKGKRNKEQGKMDIESGPELVQSQQIKQQKQPEKVVEMNVFNMQEIPVWAVTILDELFDEQYKSLDDWVAPKVIKVIDLPQKYYWDMTENVCDSCKKMCDDLFLCLLCRWKGCLNSCRSGGLQGHNKKVHGEGGVFFRLNDANMYLITPGEIKKAGCLYTNEWGEDFDRKKDWGDYYLQSSVIDKGVGMMLKDE